MSSPTLDVPTIADSIRPMPVTTGPALWEAEIYLKGNPVPLVITGLVEKMKVTLDIQNRFTKIEWEIDDGFDHELSYLDLDEVAAIKQHPRRPIDLSVFDSI